MKYVEINGILYPVTELPPGWEPSMRQKAAKWRWHYPGYVPPIFKRKKAKKAPTSLRRKAAKVTKTTV